METYPNFDINLWKKMAFSIVFQKFSILRHDQRKIIANRNLLNIIKNIYKSILIDKMMLLSYDLLKNLSWEKTTTLQFIIQSNMQAPKSKVIEWTEEDNSRFQMLFKKYGTSWCSIKKDFPYKQYFQLFGGENYLKNRVNNNLRKLASHLNNCEYNLCRRSSRNITVPMLLSIIDVCCQAQKLVRLKGLTVNQQSKLYMCAHLIIKLCFKTNYDAEQTQQLLRQIRTVNFGMKSFGIFKQKHRKSWKLSTRVFHHILVFDKFVLEDIPQIKQDVFKNMQKQNQQRLKRLQCQGHHEQQNHEQAQQFSNNFREYIATLNPSCLVLSKQNNNIGSTENKIKIEDNKHQNNYIQRLNAQLIKIEQKVDHSDVKLTSQSKNSDQFSMEMNPKFKEFWNKKFTIISSQLVNFFILPPPLKYGIIKQES